VEERRTSQGSAANLSSTEQAIDGLVEFFTSLNMQYPPAAAHQQPEASGSAQPQTTPQIGGATNNPDDIRELEDMGVLARDLIRRIQRLREQFRPGSLAALALPDIRVEDEAEAATRLAHEAMALQMVADLGIPYQGVHLPPRPGNLLLNGLVDFDGQALALDLDAAEQLAAADNGMNHLDAEIVLNDEEMDDEDDGQFDERESSTE